MSKSGIYVIRTRKPHAVIGLPFVGRHTGYVGLTSSYAHRKVQHLKGDSRYGTAAKDWADLEPVFYRAIPLPNIRFLLEVVETITIWILCPVYNERKQPPWNIRRIRPRQAKKMRAARDAYGRGARVGWLAVRWLTILVTMWVIWTLLT